MSNSILFSLLNHLWQSTLFAAAVGCLTPFFRRNGARVRYLLWLAASVKFLIPFALLTALGAHIPLSLGPALQSQLVAPSLHVTAQLANLIGEGATSLAPGGSAINHGDATSTVFAVLWAFGTFVVAAYGFIRWLPIRRALLESAESDVPFVIPVRASALQLEPAVVGVLRPVLLLPGGMEQRLTPEEMCAVLAHEGCHVAWWDNLAGALHMLVEAVFWFHPLVWWLGTRLVDERERACDEQVLADGHRPESYAEGILKVCERYLSPPLRCAAGISGGRLSQRIEHIVSNRLVEGLSVVRKLLITAAACATVAVPIAVGVLTSPHVRAESETPASDESFRNVSIQVARPGETTFFGPQLAGRCSGIEFAPHGRVTIGCPSMRLRRVIADTYGVSESQVVGKDWSKEPSYDVTADDPLISVAERAAALRTVPAMMRNLLAKQFGMVFRRELRRMDGYVLSISPGGSKLRPYAGGPSWKTSAWMTPADGVIATDYPVGALAGFLQYMFKVPIVDQTGLKGRYEYRADWKTSSPGAPPDAATVAKALEQQLGLRLEAKPVTVEVINVLSLKSPDEVVTGK